MALPPLNRLRFARVWPSFAVLWLIALDPVPLSAEDAFAHRPEVQAFVQRMATTYRFDAADLTRRFAAVQEDLRVIELVKPPSEPGKKNWTAYRQRFLDRPHLRAGVAFWRAHAKELAKVEKDTGVPAEILVGILGVETFWGTRMGSFPTFDALATLAFDFPDSPKRAERQAFFLTELEAFLLWCRDAGQDPGSLKGSYAGALGIPQFMPGNLKRFGQDGDGDGRVDLLGSVPDALASAAKFLLAHGWQKGQPVAWRLAPGAATRRAAEAKADGDPLPKHRLGDLVKAGLRPQASAAAQKRARETPTLIVDLPSPGHPTEYRLGFQNFYVITRYNRSFFYAMAVTELGRTVAARRGK